MEEENARLREEAKVCNIEKANLQFTVDELNKKIHQIVNAQNLNQLSESVTIRPIPTT